MIERILGGLYILDIGPINDGSYANHNISHVLSVVPGPLPEFPSHLQIEIADDEEADLLLHLPQAIAFINKGLFDGEPSSSKKHSANVLVHCAQGQSRSVAVVTAFLCKTYNLSYEQSLHAIKRKVSFAEPNPGFEKQVRQFIAQESEAGQGDAESSSEKETAFKLRCKICRCQLAVASELELHEQPGLDSRQSLFIKRAPNSRRIISKEEAAQICSHYFMAEPASWMQPELEKQSVEGKFSCPKCEAKVGAYSWKGSRCSCGKWMVPAIHLQSAKVDKLAL